MQLNSALVLLLLLLPPLPVPVAAVAAAEASGADPAADNASDRRNANTMHNTEYAIQKAQCRMHIANTIQVGTSRAQWLRLQLEGDYKRNSG